MDRSLLTPIIKTKLQIPTRHPNLLARLHLVEKLQEGLQWGRKLTLISASAGFGKTSLLSEWAHMENDTRSPWFAWLSLEEEDNIRGRFWVYLTAALQNVFPDIGEATTAILRSPDIPTDEVTLTPLLNELAAQPENIVLVLDDFQFISNEEIHNGVNFLVDHLPPQVHLVLSTRADPPLSIVHWRGQGQLTELRGDELRFTRDEVDALLNTQMGLNLEAEDLQTITARTEGWITGLQLAAISLKGHPNRHAFVNSFSTSPYIVIEYLTEEVLKIQPPEVQQFLLKTSILTRLNSSLCDRVMGQENSGEMLRLLYKGNLFITPLDPKHQWFRYHPLFADLLRSQLISKLDKENVIVLHQRASSWYEEHGYLQIAVRHAQETGDSDRVAGLAEKAVDASLLDSWMTNLLTWLETFPETVLRSRLKLRIYQASALFFDGQIKQCMNILAETKQAIQQLPATPENKALADDLWRLTEIIYAFVEGLELSLQGLFEQAAPVIHRSLHLAEQAGNVFFLAHAYEGLALMQYHQGQLRAAANTCQRLIELAGGNNQKVHLNQTLPIATAGYLLLANIYLDQNNLEAMEHQVKKSFDLCRKSGGAKSLVETYVMQSRLQQARGDLDSAYQSISRAERTYHLKASRVTRFRLDSQKARLDLEMGKLEKVSQWIHRLGQEAPSNDRREPLPAMLSAVVQLILARLLLIEKELEEALKVLRMIQGQAEAGGHNRHLIEIHLHQALAFHTLDQHQLAEDAIQRALRLAEPEGFVRVFLDGAFLDNGFPIKDLLERAAEGEAVPKFAEKVLAHFSRFEAREPKICPELVDPLSQREIEVLEHLAKGMNNRQIARQLVITIDTVKTHTGNIYGKLGVHNRTQAVIKARELGLIEQ